MLAALAPFQAAFELDVVDIDAHVALEQRYGEDVPVLLAGKREICRHRLDAAALTAYLNQQDSSDGFAAPQGQIG